MSLQYSRSGIANAINNNWIEDALTDLVSSNLLVVEGVDEPIFRVNDLNRSFHASMIHREDYVTADSIDEINVQDIFNGKCLT